MTSRCSAIHSDSPTLLCTLGAGHKTGWHHDDEYGKWVSLHSADPGDPGVLMPTKTAALKYNVTVSATYRDVPGLVGVAAVWSGYLMRDVARMPSPARSTEGSIP